MLVALGIITYYFAPLAFIMKNYTLFFLILNLVLIIMILGLAFLSLMLLPTTQNLLINTFLFLVPKDRLLKKVIQKNLLTHENRNTKTALMFVIALSFLIFSGSIFELMGTLIISVVESTMGGVDLYATSLFS